MSRLYTRNNRGRQPMLGSGSRTNKSKEQDTYYPPNSKKNKNVPRPAVTKKAAAPRKRAASTSSSDLSSLLDSETGDDASGEEESEEEVDDDEDDLPAVRTPSRSRSLNGAGRKHHLFGGDDISVAGSVDSMFGDLSNYYEEDDDPTLSPEENRKRFESHVFGESDDDNDEVYQAVDEISDSEDDVDDRHVEEQELLAMMSEEANSDADFLLNQIDGLSAYGFGDDSDASIQRYPSSQGSDTGFDAGLERHVHFAVDADPSIFLRMSESPTITRALLPSALPELNLNSRMPERRPVGLVDDLDDSDLTDDCLPEEAHQITKMPAREKSRSTTPPAKKSARKAPRRRGPPRGIFIDEGDKTSGILDPSGKIILMTNPHLLGDEFAKRYGASATSSPDVGFAELIEDSDAGDRESAADVIGVPGADIMLASLNSAVNDPSNLGQAIGPLEAFYPSNSFVFGDYAIDPDDLEENFQPDEDIGEDVIDLHDVIKFDDETDDSDAPTSPMFMPPSHELSGLGNVNNEFAYLNNNNVTAFRRNADPTFAALNNTPRFQRDMDAFSSPFSTPAPSRRKRKNHASPYTSSHYKGVTPVQRMWDPNPPNPTTPETSTPAPSKRRRVMI
ncbi:hypothetical protein LTR10_020070 [Elasticomyces elasticus]|uniref:Uncharacterized protein n=1 Tax=Exophiala sideris TaxID=1016849 RepID=A0ABR0IWQ5_9EURO|nr:hypothetical protein LTR10_020070 [Elasticomyces elasticus]KAK5021348.1 hypothetical protein LTS07_011091 [Exophiala sideris]KAK5024296.1 hypothetical protein LTR13_010917 [Exophiala sideris]KAK5049239.1 hypothetical protein LTR69_011114 [Exophiala sideris]KAK5176551.1 hypothetical protein LTR44_010939 [Eurotiomycetes sp. CCFEE 6388]